MKVYNYIKLYSINNIILFAFLLVNIGMLLFYSIVTYQALLHTDSATKLLLANEVLTSGEILPSGWYYANNDVWFFLIHIFLVPLIDLFGLNYFSYILNNIFFYIFYGLSIYFFVSSLNVTQSTKILITILSISSLSYLYAEFLFGQLAYISTYIFVFLFLGLMHRIFLSGIGEIRKYYVSFFLIIFIFTIHNPQRALIYYFIPVIFVNLYLFFANDKLEKKYITLSIISFLSFVLATIFYYSVVIIQDVSIMKGANNLLFASYVNTVSNINIFFSGLFDTFNLVDKNQVSPFSFEGILRILSFTFFFLIIYSLLKIQCFLDKQKDIVILVAYLLFIYYLAVNLFLYVFTVPLAQNETTFRYFYPVILLSFILISLFLHLVRLNGFLKKTSIILIVVFLSISNYKIYIKPSFSHTSNIHENLGKYLSDNKLTYGFASYWHSYVTTVFAKNNALVAPIHLSAFEPMRWLSSENWYHKYDINKTFIIYTNNEFNHYAENINKKIGYLPSKVEVIGGFKVAIYNKNIAYRLNRIYKSDLRNGIIFTKEGYPQFIKKHIGFSGFEPSYRWSEGKKSILVFNEELPNNFVLKFAGTPFIASENRALRIACGDTEKLIKFKPGYNSYSVKFNDVVSDTVVFEYENPKSPLELGISKDPRKLSFSYHYIKIM